MLPSAQEIDHLNNELEATISLTQRETELLAQVALKLEEWELLDANRDPGWQDTMDDIMHLLYLDIGREKRLLEVFCRFSVIEGHDFGFAVLHHWKYHRGRFASWIEFPLADHVDRCLAALSKEPEEFAF